MTVCSSIADRVGLHGERALDVREVVLHDADHRELEVGEIGRGHLGLALRTFVLEHLGLGVGRGLAGHVELHADLVQLQRRQLARERARPTSRCSTSMCSSSDAPGGTAIVYQRLYAWLRL